MSAVVPIVAAAGEGDSMAKKRPICPRPGAVKFFHEWGGYSKRPGQGTAPAKQGSARRLAMAECHAAQQGIEFEWEWDHDPDLSWMDDEARAEEHEVYCARAILDGRTLDSLCGIVDPDRNYRRVIEAELALDHTPWRPRRSIRRRRLTGARSRRRR